MKKRIIFILFSGLFTLWISSCEDNFLDKAPEASFTEEEVFANYENFKKYFDAVYNGWPGGMSINQDRENLKNAFNLWFAGNPRKFSLDQLTDLTDGGRIREHQIIKGGQMGSLIYIFYDDHQQRPHITTMFRIIRVCNTALNKINLLKNVEQQEIDYLLAQIHFVRAFAHFALFRLWGPLPYITHVIGPYDDWDIPRLSKHETCMQIAADMDTAYTFYEKANKIRVDNPVVGGVGHLNHPDMFRPNGVAAKAMKGRVLLYAASPQNNELGQKDWEEAAKANWEAIQIAEQNGYELLTADNYKLNYVGTNYSNEQLWAWAAGAVRHNSGMLKFLINGVFGASTGDASGDNPTQNCVDMFETKWGDPLNTQADRDAATALGHYNEQDPYSNRDPRFYIDIIYNQASIPGYNIAQIYYEDTPSGIFYSELLNQSYAGITHTGYYERKLWGYQSVKNDVSPLLTDPIIRLGELYLNYAEAANEAYGPNIPAPGATLTAVQAINVIRQRIGQADVQDQFTTSKEIFRSRIKNERTVELCFEGHYYFDIRRWLDAPVTMQGPLMGMTIEKVPVSPEYPIGFKHTRVPIPANRQSIWKDEMYYLPFKTEDYYKMKNFDMSINPMW